MSVLDCSVECSDHNKRRHECKRQVVCRCKVFVACSGMYHVPRSQEQYPQFQMAQRLLHLQIRCSAMAASYTQPFALRQSAHTSCSDDTEVPHHAAPARLVSRASQPAVCIGSHIVAVKSKKYRLTPPVQYSNALEFFFFRSAYIRSRDASIARRAYARSGCARTAPAPVPAPAPAPALALVPLKFKGLELVVLAGRVALGADLGEEVERHLRRIEGMGSMELGRVRAIDWEFVSYQPAQRIETVGAGHGTASKPMVPVQPRLEVCIVRKV